MLRTVDEIEHISEDYQVEFYDYEKTFYGSTSNPDADVKADFNQNDPLAKGYIKNRTHYTDDDGTVHVLMATKKIIEVDTVNSLSDNDSIFVNSSSSLKQISKSNLVINGEDGGYYAPSVDDEGNLT